MGHKQFRRNHHVRFTYETDMSGGNSRSGDLNRAARHDQNDGILETAIHTKGVLGLAPIYSNDRLSAYAVAGRDILSVFRKGATGQTVTLPSGTIPGHGGDGALLWRLPLAR